MCTTVGNVPDSRALSSVFMFSDFFNDCEILFLVSICFDISDF